jgi:hypothetical protein
VIGVAVVVVTRQQPALGPDGLEVPLLCIANPASTLYDRPTLPAGLMQIALDYVFPKGNKELGTDHSSAPCVLGWEQVFWVGQGSFG